MPALFAPTDKCVCMRCSSIEAQQKVNARRNQKKRVARTITPRRGRGGRGRGGARGRGGRGRGGRGGRGGSGGRGGASPLLLQGPRAPLERGKGSPPCLYVLLLHCWLVPQRVS